MAPIRPARSEHDVLIIGGGVAGLTLALHVAGTRRVTLVRPASDDQGASRWAQGGIAAVLSPQDDFDAHVADTLVAGDGLCDERAVRFTVEQGPAAIEWLLSLGVPFTRDESPSASYPYHLTREGGHGARRIIHAEDATGRAVLDTLKSHVEAHPAIAIRDDLVAIGLMGDAQQRCRGARCVDERGQLQELLAGDTVLATGGASGLYRHTTSPHPASGEGMMMAAELGAELMNLEFQQFHPTCLYDPGGPPFLISEAVRGEGGRLYSTDGHRFMLERDERAELAPRDIVARAIDAEMQRTGSPHVWLDVTHLGDAAIRRHFPTIYAHCLHRGLDITRAPIPVVPAAHYSCGGVATDLDGSSSVPHLYAIGEVACTGLHGANRMASNSLLECLVYARSCAGKLALRAPAATSSPTAGTVGTKRVEAHRVEQWRTAMRDIMSRHVAIVRRDAGLEAASRELSELNREIQAAVESAAPDTALASLWHAVRLARLTVMAARQRRESRGLHFNPDCPPHDQTGLAPRPSRLHLADLPD
ncbi:L-aspartate oxidase [Halomonas sp. MCCC 1A17488]|uniref:L-aspartate oxidase n=1 Tax=unclassified Halomonas TaxID=2609666 RepID=UPI0018D26AE9|nr:MULTISPECIES: L-aspartate oxidase [unclassified Halomonas]MCE8014763.1 L-aspartate oxidase [Halomonas sp. MCCC 1A17488]MCG3238096.1 L-aspartate oxidase [Halomonas sp. MCCC 1A17488]QPP48130.1 L-aspartate oxidase [Halomonas sp. SS10-MC5]